MIRTRRTFATTLAAATLVALPLAGCGDTAADTASESTTSAEASESPSPSSDEGGTGIGESADGGAADSSLDGKVGQEVSFMAEVEKMIPPNALTVGGEEIGENPILVVGADLPQDVEVGDSVQVRGTVAKFDLVGFEDELGIDLVDNEFTDYDGGLAIKATTAGSVKTM